MALAYQKRYGLGDAQIDAQNRVGDIMAQVVASIAAATQSGTLTRDLILSGENRIQTAIDSYSQMWAGTTRGKAGLDTLQAFYINQLKPDMDRQLATIPTGEAYAPAAPTGDLNATPQLAPYDPGIDYSINVGIPTGSASTPANIQISNTPGPPAGIATPAPNVAAPDWMKNPLLWIVGGIGLMFLLKKGGNS